MNVCVCLHRRGDVLRVHVRDDVLYHRVYAFFLYDDADGGIHNRDVLNFGLN